MRKTLLLVASAMLILVAGCAKNVPVTVMNDLGDYDISAVYIFPTTQASRGEDLQAADLAPGQSAVFQVLPGAYNILVLDEDGDSYYYENVTVPAEGYTATVSLDDLNWEHVHVGTGHYPLNITNNLSEYDFWYLYIDPTGTEPTTEYMGSNIIFPGETITVWMEPGTYDVQVWDDTDFSYTFEGVTVADAAVTLPVTDADIDEARPAEQATTVTVRNDLGSWDIYYLYIDRSDEPWGDDRLGSEILSPGESFTVEITTGTWDMQAEDVDGDTYTLWQQEIGPEGFVWSVTIDQMD